MIGSAIGSLVGPEGIPIGAMLGQQAGASIASIGGYGRYKIKKNTLMQQKPPAMVNTDTRGGSIIQMREYLGDIVSAATANTFKIDTFPINVGLAETFPLGSEISRNYQKYQLMGCVFEFRSMSGNALNSVNTALGQVVSCVDTTCVATYSSKILVEDTDGGQSCKPSECMLIPVECQRDLVLGNVAYVRAGAVPRGQDVKTFDYGNLIIGSNGIQGTNVNLGELWVTYQVKLIAPRLFDNLGLAIGYFNYVNFSYTLPLPLGNGTVWTATANTLACTVTVGNTINFPKVLIPRKFILYINWEGDSAIGITTPPSVNGYNSLNFWNPYLTSAFVATSSDQSPNSSTTYTMTVVYGIEIVPGPLAYITFGTASGLPVTPLKVQIVITEVPSNAGGPILQPTLEGGIFKQTPQLTLKDEICSVEDCDHSIENEDEIPDFVKRYLARKGVKL